MENRLARNRKSPSNEEDFIAAYKELNPSSKRKDGYDIAAVLTSNGEKGHALMDESFNRGRDYQYHHVKNFIPDSELKKKMK